MTERNLKQSPLPKKVFEKLGGGYWIDLAYIFRLIKQLDWRIVHWFNSFSWN